jgi:hypothetical protein
MAEKNEEYTEHWGREGFYGDGVNVIRAHLISVKSAAPMRRTASTSAMCTCRIEAIQTRYLCRFF